MKSRQESKRTNTRTFKSRNSRRPKQTRCSSTQELITLEHAHDDFTRQPHPAEHNTESAALADRWRPSFATTLHIVAPGAALQARARDHFFIFLIAATHVTVASTATPATIATFFICSALSGMRRAPAEIAGTMTVASMPSPGNLDWAHAR